MAEESESVEIRARMQSSAHLLRGAIAGFVAAVVMAVVIAVLDLGLFDTIAALYQQGGSPLFGAFAHVVHGTLFGVLFALVLSDPGLYAIEDQLVKSIVAGVVFGLALAIAGAGMIMPIWLNVIGASQSLPVPFITAPLIVYHLVYGTILGAVYELVDF